MYEVFEHRTTKKKDFVFCYWITVSKSIQNDTMDKRIEQWNALNLFQTIESTLIHSSVLDGICSTKKLDGQFLRNWTDSFNLVIFIATLVHCKSTKHSVTDWASIDRRHNDLFSFAMV